MSDSEDSDFSASENEENDASDSDAKSNDSATENSDAESNSDPEDIADDDNGPRNGVNSDEEDNIQKEKDSDEEDNDIQKEKDSDEEDNDAQNEKDSDEGSFDEDFEEDEDEDRSKKKKKKEPRYGGFILDEAEVDDDVEEDDEEWEEGAEDIIDKTQATEEDRSKDIESNRRLQMMWTSEKEDEIEAYYRKKYVESCAAEKGYYDDSGNSELPEEIAQQTLLPSVKDPNLWMVKCRIGEEKATVLHLMRKFLAYQKTDEPLQITSVVAPENVKGYIYIEAFKQTHVKEAIENIGNLRMGQYQQTLIPIKEMPDTLRVAKDPNQLKVKQFVRLKRGVFKDDLAQIDFVNLAQNHVNLKLLPRIDYTKKRGALRVSEQEKRKKI